MGEENPHQAEIRKILLGSLSHYGNTLRDFEAGRTVEECASDRQVKPERIVYLREMILDGRRATEITRVRYQAAVYQDLLNYSMSPELRQHIDLGFAQFQQVDPKLKKEPLKYTKLGANQRGKKEEPEEACSQCRTVHAGECW